MEAAAKKNAGIASQLTSAAKEMNAAAKTNAKVRFPDFRNSGLGLRACRMSKFESRRL